MPTPPHDFTLPFLKKENIAKDTYSFYFDRAKGDSGETSDIEFVAGNYIRMILPHVNPDERGTSRLFSLASSPLQKDHIMITTKNSESSFKKVLHALTPGVEVQFFGPVGRFLLDENDLRPRVFLAGGIGMTPFHSMIMYSAEKQLRIPITLFASFSTTDEIIYYNEMIQASKKNPSIKIIYTVSRPEESQKPWEGEKGRISKVLIEKYVQNYQNNVFMVAGPPTMVGAMIEIVKEMGIPDEQIKKEQFTGY